MNLTRVTPARERLLSRLIPQPNGCWHWTGVIDGKGYGRVGYKGVRGVPVQRAIYDLMVGPIPAGKFLDHVCHSEDPDCDDGPACMHRRCGNPYHLEPVEPAVNTQRNAPTRRTHCPRGHEYSEQNTYRNGGRRFCRACQRARQAVSA